MSKRFVFLWVASLSLWMILGMALAADPTDAGCERYEPNPPNEPTGVKGCEVYGEGTASWYSGPGAARNDCVWPFQACQPVSVTSLDTGRTIVVTPTMYCDCYTGTSQERIIDLAPSHVAALGLDPALGLYRVVVEPATYQPLPDTAVIPHVVDRELVLLGALLVLVAILIWLERNHGGDR